MAILFQFVLNLQFQLLVFTLNVMDLRNLQRIEFLELLKAFGVANEGIVGQRVNGAGLVCDLAVDLVLVELVLLGFVFDELQTKPAPLTL